MENLKQEALNILSVAKEIHQQTGATYENAIKALEKGRKQLDSDKVNTLFEFAQQQYLSAVEKQEAQRAKWEAENEAQQEFHLGKLKLDEPEAEAEPEVKLPRAKAQ